MNAQSLRKVKFMNFLKSLFAKMIQSYMFLGIQSLKVALIPTKWMFQHFTYFAKFNQKFLTNKFYQDLNQCLDNQIKKEAYDRDFAYVYQRARGFKNIDMENKDRVKHNTFGRLSDEDKLNVKAIKLEGLVETNSIIDNSFAQTYIDQAIRDLTNPVMKLESEELDKSIQILKDYTDKLKKYKS